jgi:hypothetical protein
MKSGLLLVELVVLGLICCIEVASRSKQRAVPGGEEKAAVPPMVARTAATAMENFMTVANGFDGR